jgi:hypothetical protein
MHPHVCSNDRYQINDRVFTEDKSLASHHLARSRRLANRKIRTMVMIVVNRLLDWFLLDIRLLGSLWKWKRVMRFGYTIVPR